MNRAFSDQLSVVRPGQKPLIVNPYATQAPAKPVMCCVAQCGRVATAGTFCDECFAQYETITRWEERALERKARRWRFVNGFLLFAGCELVVGCCIQMLAIWQACVLYVVSAAVFGLGYAIYGGDKVKGS